MSLGLKLLVGLIDAVDGTDQFARFRMEPSLFVGEAENKLFTVASEHLKKYGKLPSRATVDELTGGTPMPSELPEPPAFYLDRIKERYVFLRLRDTMKHAETLMNDDRSNDALQALMSTTSLCHVFMHKDRIVDFVKEGHALVKIEYLLKLAQGDDYGLKLGWPTLDAMTGGLTGGDLVSIIGRPGTGKTYLALYAAFNAWKHKHVPMFVSMEMKPLLIAQRLAALTTSKSITQLKNSAMSDWALADMSEQLQVMAQQDQPFWLIDGALSSTVDDLILLARQLRPTVMFVDGAYLLRETSSYRGSKWERLANIAERLKAEVAEQLNIPVVLTYQFNRDMMKKKKNNDVVGLEDIAGTDAIGQLSSLVLGMIQEDSIETLRQRKLQVLKGRSGEQGSVMINWNFDVGPNFMDFSELPADAASSDLAYT